MRLSIGPAERLRRVAAAMAALATWVWVSSALAEAPVIPAKALERVEGESDPRSGGKRPLRRVDVVRTALMHHPALAGAEAKQRAAEGKHTKSQGAYDTKLAGTVKTQPLGKSAYGLADIGLEQPTVAWGLTVRGGWRLGAGDVPVYLGGDDTREAGEAYVGLSLPLLEGGATDTARTDMARAALEVDAAGADVAMVALGVRRAATQAYWAWVAAHQSLRVDEELLRLATERDERIQTSATRGDLAPIDAVDNERAILSRRGRVVKSQAALQKAAQTLSLFWRDADGSPLVPDPAQAPAALPDPVEPPSSDAAARDVEAALQQRPDLSRLAREAQAALVDLDLAHNQELPRLDLLFDVAQGLAPSSTLQAKDTEVQVGLKLAWPLQRRKARGDAETARAIHAQVEQKARLLCDEIEADIGKIHAELRAAYDAVDLATRELEVARRVERAERRRLELGESTLLLVNLREVATADAAQKRIAAQQEYHTVWGDYEAVIAAPIDMGPADAAGAERGVPPRE